MWLTRSIRRKLVLSLGLVMLMLLVVAGSGVSGLLAYRAVIDDLNFSINEAPRRSDLVSSIGELLKPLLHSPTATRELREIRRLACQQRIAQTRDELTRFRQRLQELPRTEGIAARKVVIEQMLPTIEGGLDQLELRLPDLVDEQRQYQAADDMLRIAADLEIRMLDIPSPLEGLHSRVSQAKLIYQSHLWTVLVCGGIATVLFFGLIRCGYLWIFVPIRKLHEGASRIAQGDFRYRLQLSGQDEMVSLASVMNRMTQRFQEIRDDLDREVRERSRQLVRSERLAGVGFLASGVAHEINNPLSAISMAAESLEMRVHTEDPQSPIVWSPDDAAVARQYLGMIQREASRCREITQRLLNFSRGQDAPRMRVNLAEVIGEVLDLVAHLGKFRGHTIRFDRTHACYATVNSAELKQVVLNLVANALESTPLKGELEIIAEERADETMLTFRDNGCGMTAEVRENLFEPFFTTKAAAKGTGLGLSISHRIVTEHGGRIEAASDGPGKGSVFYVHLPRTPAEAQRAA